MLGYQPWRCMKHNLITDVVIKPRWFLKIVWENFVVKQFAFFYVRIVKGPKTNIFTCKLCAWVIFIILFTRLLCDNSNSLTYEPRKGAKSNTFTCQLCDCISHADWLFTIIIVRDLSEISRGEGGGNRGRFTTFRDCRKGRVHEKWAIKRGRVMQICVRDHVEVHPQRK